MSYYRCHKPVDLTTVMKQL